VQAFPSHAAERAERAARRVREAFDEGPWLSTYDHLYHNLQLASGIDP
jgi:hypothetical protein